MDLKSEISRPNCGYNRLGMLAYLITTAGLAAAACAGYQSMSPTGQWYGSTFTGSGGGSKQLALTYDDGPNDPHTLRLLEVLAKHDVRATFFLIGRYAEQRPDIVRAVVEGGHVVGNHTYNHRLLTFRSAAQVRADLELCGRALCDVIGEPSHLFRPPFGGRRPGVLRIARQMGLAPVMWSVTGYDWNAPPADEIERKVTNQVRGGDVILLHDGGHLEMGADRSQTVTATDRLIAKYKSEGRQFVTIPAMMEAMTAGRRTTTGREPGATPTDSGTRSRAG
jgi:peptidoglycan/xylan/chitin deacetylase (PgdA/CDA1 family)